MRSSAMFFKRWLMRNFVSSFTSPARQSPMAKATKMAQFPPGMSFCGKAENTTTGKTIITPIMVYCVRCEPALSSMACLSSR